MDNSTQDFPKAGMRIPAAKRMAYYASMLMLLLFTGVVANAQYSTVPVTGFTADVILDGNSLTSATADVDGGSFYFLDSSFSALGTPTYALPATGLLHSVTTSGLNFQLAPASGNNSVRLATSGAIGALTFNTPQSAGTLYVLGVSGNGASTLTITVQFTDSTNQVFNSQSLSDWYGGSNPVMKAIGRVKIQGTNGSTSYLDGSATDPEVYQVALSISSANYSKQIAYVSFNKTNSTGIAQIMGISVQAPCVTPTAQPTALTFPTVGVTQLGGSFTASAGANSQTVYLVVRYPNGTSPVAPTNGTTYAAGSTALTGGVVVSSAAGTSFTDGGLTLGTTYTYYIYAAANTVCAGGPLYNTTSPLTASKTTNSCGTLSGVIPVGPTAPASPAGFATLTAASTYINNNGLGGSVTLELQSDYTSTTESFPISFINNPCIAATKKVTIRPSAAATGLVITNSTSSPTIDLNGAQYVTIDGRPGGTGTTIQLSIINTNASGVAVRITNDASNNKITYCDLQGQNTGNSPSATVATGVVFFGSANATTLNGNDNDTLSYCNIHATTGGTPAMGVVSFGTTTSVASYNDNSVITNCNIYDFFLASSTSTGLKLDQGNNAWTITNNSVYQTTARVYTAGSFTHRGFWITPGYSTTTASGFTITGNYIGGSQPQAGGAPYNMSGAFTNSFFAMDVSVGNVTTSGVESNVITNFIYSSSNTATTSFVGINLANGNVDCGSGGANTIGSATAAGAISFTTSGTLGGLMGIRTTGGTSNTFTINNNIIAGISLNGSTTSVCPQFAGINAAGGVTININNNTIGSATMTNSIYMGTAFSGNSTTNYTMQGIWISTATTTTITGNLIANMNTNYTVASTASSSVRGIYVNASTAIVANNTIRNLSSASQTTGTGQNCAIVGIAMVSSSGAHLVSGNTIHSLKLTGPAVTSVGITGIFVSTSSTLASTFSKNFIHSLTLTAANNAAVVTGFDVGGGRSTFANNMIRLGIDSSGADITAGVQFRGFTKGVTTANNYYYNSVYIGGSNVVGTQASFAFARGAVPANTPNDSVVNNIFVNARSNAAGGTGKHYAAYLSAGTTFLTMSNNLYYANGTGGTFGATSSTVDVTSYTAGWAGSDANSVYADPHFKTPGGTAGTVDLHISTAVSSQANNAGLAITAVTTDFDGDTRSATTPDIGADEFVGSTLPITLVSFQGQKQGSSNILSWTTATEINSSGFELQRGIDGSTFTALTFVASKATGGSSTSLLTYQSTDASPLATDNYYRLKLVDKDGSYTYSNTVLLKGDATNSTTAVIAMYPNPVADHLNIVINAKENNNISLIVNDMNGRLISSQNVQLVPGTNSMQVNVSHLAKGTYAVKIVTADGKAINTSLFVK